MSEIRFSSKEHEKFFYQMLAKCGKHDSYYSSFFYCVGISEDTRNHVDRMFDFKERLIKPEALHEGWQTGGSARLTRLAFNLWNGYVEKGEESLSTPYEMFDCGYAPYFYEAIRIKYYSDFNPDCSYHVNDHNNRCWSVHWNFAVYENRAGCEPKRKPICNISSTQQGTSTETP